MWNKRISCYCMVALLCLCNGQLKAEEMDEADESAFVEETLGAEKLHKSLRNFDRLMVNFSTDTHIVRVDRMPDQRYRLALWTSPSRNSMDSQPVMVLYGEQLDKSEKKFSFTHGDLDIQVVAVKGNEHLKVYYKNNYFTMEQSRTFLKDLRKRVEYTLHAMYGASEIKPILLYIQDDHVVLVGKNKKDNYQYASWQINPQMSLRNKPDMLIRKGTFTGDGYVFRNGHWGYRVPLNTLDDFQILYDDGVLNTERILWRYTAEQIQNFL